MKQFKYLIEQIKWMDINSSLYDKGKLGWELIQIIPQNSELILIYKREDDGTI